MDVFVEKKFCPARTFSLLLGLQGKAVSLPYETNQAHESALKNTFDGNYLVTVLSSPSKGELSRTSHNICFATCVKKTARLSCPFRQPNI